MVAVQAVEELYPYPQSVLADQLAWLDCADC